MSSEIKDSIIKNDYKQMMSRYNNIKNLVKDNNNNILSICVSYMIKYNRFAMLKRIYKDYNDIRLERLLYEAAYINNYKIVKFLLSHNIRVTDTYLRIELVTEMVTRRYVNILRLLLYYRIIISDIVIGGYNIRDHPEYKTMILKLEKDMMLIRRGISKINMGTNIRKCIYNPVYTFIK